jgi:hypothetical protein
MVLSGDHEGTFRVLCPPEKLGLFVGQIHYADLDSFLVGGVTFDTGQEGHPDHEWRIGAEERVIVFSRFWRSAASPGERRRS